ncbi:MAG TPA: LacI family DNA-binding transcriptional regulator [Candidatus Methylacidiphilales bacterium]
MGTRITIRDIAAEAGVHFTTVARALKNDPRVHPDTLAHVQKIARELGYIPDPMLSSLMAYRQSNRTSDYHGTIGWITADPTRDGWQWEAFRLYRQGAAEALARQGYRLEDFWMKEPGLTAKRASQILFNRGIRGLLICPLHVSDGHLSLQWEQFAAVTFGYTLFRPALHLCTASHYHSLHSCMRKLHLLGYRRVGLAITQHLNQRMDQIWTAAYHIGFSPQRSAKYLPPFYIPGNNAPTPGKPSREKFLAWFRKHEPDAVIFLDWDIVQWLRDEGLRIPEDVGLASPILQESQVAHSGILEPSRDIGRVAADFVVGMIQRGEFGSPRIPQRILLEGRWNPGTTVSQITVPRSRQTQSIN